MAEVIVGESESFEAALKRLKLRRLREIAPEVLQAAKLQRELDQENETLSLLHAEWSLLIQPARAAPAGDPA